jgi:hypothetical protein
MKDVGHFSKIFVCTDAIDFRKQAYGLSSIVKDVLKENPIEARCLFVFSNRRRNGIRMLYCDFTGFALWSKALEKDGCVASTLCQDIIVVLPTILDSRNRDCCSIIKESINGKEAKGLFPRV